VATNPTTATTIATAGSHLVTVTVDTRKPALVGLALGDEFGPVATVWLDAAGRAELVAALTDAHLASHATNEES